jgi:hypothetical protein
MRRSENDTAVSQLAFSTNESARDELVVVASTAAPRPRSGFGGAFPPLG